ncbi:MAG: Coenzyme F420 hydrogenase/dehydrogenase, beta subunit C-terminal domain [Anaerolineae bacterium]|nr:Coenzyme F420 hydrogenase/dehydrogenase, beta subunit C-terminal domain [Anaerolineae bacterium]
MMTDLTAAIRQEVARILDEGIVDVVIGFEAGTLPLRTQPAFITRAADSEKLVLNGFCQNNLAAFLTRRPKDERIGIVCRGCESRAVRALLVERQHSREKLYVIGVPCTGILDWREITRQVGEDVLDAVEEQDEIVVTTRDGQHRFQRANLMHDSCARCVHPNPVGADITFGDPLPEGDPDVTRASVAEFEALTPEERYAYFTAQAERCIRCYACREACPMCYCTECFVDHTMPRWAESMTTSSGTQGWHIVRAFHQTGRCVSCGACERTCPMDIRMTYLTDKLSKDMWELYEFETGADEESQPPFAAFTLDDKQRFVR